MLLIQCVLSCISGDGYKVLVNMLKYIGPTHIVKIGLKNLPVGKFGSNGKNDRRVKLIEIYPARQDSLYAQMLYVTIFSC